MDDILKRVGLKYDDLNPTEKDTYAQMLEGLKQGMITPAIMLDSIQNMKYAVEEELVDTPEKIWFIFSNRKHIFLKARLKNYMLIESFLLTPKKARRLVENALGNIKKA